VGGRHKETLASWETQQRFGCERRIAVGVQVADFKFDPWLEKSVAGGEVAERGDEPERHGCG
jgi:hypothetical protein